MTRDDTKKFLMTVQAFYPNFKPPDYAIALNAWHSMIKDYDTAVVSASLKAYVAEDKTGFAPSVGAIIQKINLLTAKPEINEMEAWGMVSRAIRNGYYGAEEEFSKLPPLVQKAVGTPANLRNWAQTDLKTLESVIGSNFIKTYRALAVKNEEVKRLPPEALAIMQKSNRTMIEEKI